MKNVKGITLIALVITIVVLIILAGVAISLSLGENGIFNKAKYASEQYANEQAREEIEIAKTANEIDSYVGSSREETVTLTKSQYEDMLNRIAKLETKTAKFPDYTNLLTTLKSPGLSWTATEDCFVVCGLTPVDGGAASVYVDGVTIANYFDTGSTNIRTSFYIKEGSTISTRQIYGGYDISIYGLEK